MSRSAKILIVEDEAIIAESIFQLLRLLNYDPMEPLDNAADACRMISETEPDLAIIDIRLGKELAGFEVMDYIATQKLDIPFIILTAFSDSETITRAKKYNPNAYLVKPFQRDSLYAAIEIALPENITAGKNTIIIKTGNRQEQIRYSDIVFLQAKGQYTELHMKNGNKRLLRISLSGFIKSHEHIKWQRIHKSYAVNPDYIQSIANGKITVQDIELPVGRLFQEQVATEFTGGSNH